MWWGARLFAVLAAAAAFSLPLLAQSPTLPGFPPGVFASRGALDKAGTPPSGWCALIPQTGLANCWSFDTAHTTSSTATDSVGGQNATLNNVILNGSGPSTNLNNSAQFNGTSSTGPTTLVNLPTTAFSLVIHLDPSTLTGNPRPVANCHTDADNNGFQMLLASGFAYINIGNGTTFAQVNTPSALTVSAWNMVTYTWDGSTLTPYLGATAGGTSAFTGPIAYTTCTTDFTFGWNPSYMNDLYSGGIAGVAVYTRAVTSGEVTTINGL